MFQSVFSQEERTKKDAALNDTIKKSNFEPKIINSISDSILKDSTNVDAKSIKFADNDLEDVVKYKATDSIIYDIPNKTVYLYGRASIKYQEMDIYAGFIQYNWDSSEVLAKAAFDDSLGAIKRVEFKDESGEYVADEAKFNFKTKKGKSRGLVMKQMEGYLHGMQVKIIDSTTLYIKGARYTTCDLDEPHFYVEIAKAKAIKDKILVGKPADIVIAGVRTPLFLPFAMVPNIKTKGTGLLMPTYGESGNLGFFLNNIGYFWNINDKVTLTTTADVYTLGSWGLHANLAYRKIYKLAGSLSFNINQQRGGSQYERFNPKRQKPPLNFGIQWQMNLDPKRMLNSSFNINLNIVSNKTYQILNSRDPQNVLATNFSSSISYSKYWPGKPYRIAVSTNLNQNTQSKQISLTLPQFSFNVTRINPFQSKINVTKRKWYENIGFSYDMNLSNQINATDSTFFTKKTLKDMRNSITHNLPISGNFTLFKYLNLNVGFNYRENWYFSYLSKTYYDQYIHINDRTGKLDTLYNQAVDQIKYGFKSYRDFNFNTNFNTQLYGTFLFKRGKLKAIRHTFRPSINFNFSPDFTKSMWHYNKNVQIDSLGKIGTYSIFQNNGITPTSKQGNIGLNFSNTLEIKVYSKKDTINHTKKITLLDNFSFGMSYNMLSKRFSPLNISASTHVTDKLNLSFNASMDPYSVDSLNRTTNQFYWKERKRFFRLTNLSLSLSGSFRSKKGTQETNQINQNILQQQGINNQFYQNNVYERGYYNFSIPWSINYQYSLNLSKYKFNKKDTTSIMQTLAVGLDVNITKKWKISVSSGFDISNKSITRTDISIIRDLHCWQMEFKWTPVGFQQGFYMTIYVTSQQFNWLKLQKQKGFFDTGIFGGLGSGGMGALGGLGNLGSGF
ncbi:MAG: hypothetical protein RJA25_887 [Bacteroidota bacterium]|jgi:hypothetical protein